MNQAITNLPERVFITGTDTEVGKTYCTSLLVKHLRQQGKSVFPFKPVSAGVESTCRVDDIAQNPDAFELWQACEKAFSVETINPIVFQAPIAPHIAAQNEGRRLDMAGLDTVYRDMPDADITLVEGAGGWSLPLNERELMSDWVAKQNLPVILVVGIRLGCLNHALLTAQAINLSGCRLQGWIANFIEGESETGRKNAEYLEQQFKRLYQADCLFEVQQGQRAL